MAQDPNHIQSSERQDSRGHLTQVVPVSKGFEQNAHIKGDDYELLYRESIESPETFWAKQAESVSWIRPWTRVKNTSFQIPVSIRWFEGAQLNVSFNCVDRHAKSTPDRVAIIWEPDNPNDPARHIAYRELLVHLNQWAFVLRQQGVKKGDRVTIYMPMIPEAAFAMLACTRIGAVHSVIFGGFSPDSIRDRVDDAKSSVIITADESVRGGRHLPLKANVDEAISQDRQVQRVLVVKHTGRPVSMTAGRDIWFHDVCPREPQWVEPEAMDAEDPLFMLYTSGSTAKPKGVLHTTAGYLVHTTVSFRTIFDHKPEDIYWCTADVGWVTGHSYIVYGPLSNGATTLMFEGVPTWPDASRLWQVVDRHRVSIFYTAPTAIRALMREGEGPVQRTERKSLRLLGSVGEPINPEAWLWYHRVVGQGRCPIVDTWWQTETGGILIAPFPGATPLKPGSATKPFFGVRPLLVDDKGTVLQGPATGNLCIADSWPGQMRTVYGDHDRFEKTYFSAYPGLYFTGDGCRRDEGGDFWITGRVDDVINVSGHRLGTAEIESSLVSHPSVAEAAVVGYTHDIKGQAIYAFVTLKVGIKPGPELKSELVLWVRKHLSPMAAPERLQFAPGLPKTRSGKIMRRILRKIAENQVESLGDTTTLADPSVVENLVKDRLLV
jgi:acetyl-CoA synthetase